MSRYPLNLPAILKQEAEDLANRQGISLNQFILWAVAEKVGELRQGVDDPAFPRITYRRGSAGTPRPVLRGTGIHVETIVTANQRWGQAEEEIAEQYDLSKAQVKEALAFYKVHQAEIDANIALNAGSEPDNG